MGLILNLNYAETKAERMKEKKQTNLQKLIENIEQKTTEEMDTDNKLQHKYVFMYAFVSQLSKKGSFQHHWGFGDFG